MDDDMVTDLGAFIRYNPEHRDIFIRQFEVLIGFLQANGLVKRCLLAEGKMPNTRTRIRERDLTLEGLQIMEAPFMRFLQSADRGQIPEKSVRILEKALKEMRENSRKARKSSDGVRRERTRRY